MDLQDKKTVMIIITLVILAVTAGGASFIFIDKLLTPSEKNVEENQEEFIPEENFPEFTKDEWLSLSRERTLMVIIDNDVQARPQAGLNEGDIIYEFPLTEGRSSFMAIYSRFNPQLIGPIGSIQDYNVEIAQNYDGIFVLKGGSSQALELLADLNNLNSLGGGVDRAFWRKNDRVEPYNLYTDTQSLRRVAAQEGFADQPKIIDFNYLNEDESFIGEKAENIVIEYGNKDYLIQYQYEKNSRRYLRNTAGNKHLDDQGRQLSAKNLIVQIVRTDFSGEKEYLKIDLEGPGRALFFADGRVQEGKWQKEQGEIQYYNEAGEKVALRPGNTWIHIVPSQKPIVYQ